MAEEREILYEYRGNRFYLELLSGWYSRRGIYIIRRVELCNSSLYLPDSCQSNPVTRWYMREAAQLSGVEFLYIPAAITEIRIENTLFPALERIEVQSGNPAFSTDGKMLFSADGRELLYSFAVGTQDRVVVSGEVRKISRNAFSHTSCSEILFENPDVSVERDAFEGSEWMKRQDNYCIVGNMFFRLKRPVDRLVIPDGIKRFHESAFWKAIPESLDTPVMPSRKNMEDLGDQRRCCRELTLRSSRAGMNLTALRNWQGLEAVHVQEGHKKYLTADGVVFSRDGRTLEFYPQGKRGKTYEIPDGVIKVGRSAFQEQAYLQEIRMPDSVITIGTSAFFRCGALEKAVLSGNIRELPDAGAYQKGGVFEQCGALREITLPRKLRYMGSYAFYASGLKQITLNKGLRQIGEYALAAKMIREISLPASLERLGKGALYYVRNAEAYIGTSRGLVSALNAAPPYYADKCANVEWGRCMVIARGKRGNRTERFLIPGSLKRSAAYHLDMAWNGEDIDFQEYDACFEAIQDAEERLEFAEQAIRRMGKDENSPYTAYLRHGASRIAVHLVEEGREKEFLAFLQRGYLSDNALSRLLKLTNQKMMTTCSAYILKYQETRARRKKKSFVL